MKQSIVSPALWRSDEVESLLTMIVMLKDISSTVVLKLGQGSESPGVGESV